MSTDALPLPDLATLPDDSATLRQLVLQLLEALQGERVQREKLEQRMDQLLRRLYCRSSEKIDPLQLLLFDAASQEAATPQEAAVPEPAAVVEPEANQAARRGHGRRPKPDHLKRVDVIHDLTEAEKQALAGDGQLVPIGEEITEQYEWQPSSLYIVRHIQKKYARQPQLLEGGVAPEQKNVITAPKPPQPIPGGIAGPGLIAEVVTNRFADHLPFHRQRRASAGARFLAADDRRLGVGRGRAVVRSARRRVARRSAGFGNVVEHRRYAPVNVRDVHGKKRLPRPILDGLRRR